MKENKLRTNRNKIIKLINGKWNVKLEMQLTILKPEGAGLLPIPIITDVKIKGYTHINRENCLGSFLLKK